MTDQDSDGPKRPRMWTVSRRAVLQAGAGFTPLRGVTDAAVEVAQEPTAQAPQAPSVEAVQVEERAVYRSAKKPAYTSWVSLFPGHDGEWYLSCEEVPSSDPPQPRSSLDHWYRMGLPDGYDKSPLRMEVVLLESRDRCASWKVVSRWPCRFQHSAGSFAAVKTREGVLVGSMRNGDTRGRTMTEKRGTLWSARRAAAISR